MISSLLPLLLATTLLATPLPRQTNQRQYRVFNQCPTAIDLYIAGAKDSTIASKGSVTKFLGTTSGFFYTDANGGSPTAEGSVKAGFLGDDFYYMVADPAHVNTGLQVKPQDRTASNGFCEVIECNSRGCPTAFTQPPTRFPAPASTAPTPPYYRCPVGNTTYDITFCPSGSFPAQPEGQPIHWNFFQNKCLDVRGAVFENGTPVQIYDCNGTPAQSWIINRGSTKVQLAGTNFCLDAGTTPANGVQLKIWQCYDNLAAQQWFYTDDNRIALQNQGFCTDLDLGDTTNSHKVQTWTCTDNNSNQVWTL